MNGYKFWCWITESFHKTSDVWADMERNAHCHGAFSERYFTLLKLYSNQIENFQIKDGCLHLTVSV